MITRVFGKKIENFYEVFHNWKQVEDDNGEIRTVYILHSYPYILDIVLSRREHLAYPDQYTRCRYLYR